MTAVQPAFKQVFNSGLYVMPNNGNNSGWCAYLLNSKLQSDSIEIDDSLKVHDGHYLFMLEDPKLSDNNVKEFMLNVHNIIFEKTHTKRACVWLDPNSESPASPSLINSFTFHKTE